MTQLAIQPTQGIAHLNISLVKELLAVIKAASVRRKTRRHLRNLPHYLLNDIGLERSDVVKELAKSFWQK